MIPKTMLCHGEESMDIVRTRDRLHFQQWQPQKQNLQSFHRQDCNEIRHRRRRLPIFVPKYIWKNYWTLWEAATSSKLEFPFGNYLFKYASKLKLRAFEVLQFFFFQSARVF